MTRLSRCGRSLLIGGAMAAASALPPSRVAEARPAKGAIALGDQPTTTSEALPLGVLRRIARDRAVHGDPLTCPDLRHCDDLTLHGIAIDLDGDGTKEWFVTDSGFTGSGAELDYLFKQGSHRRWTMIGRIEGIHLLTVGPGKTRGFLDLAGEVAGVCVEGRGMAIWNGARYVGREGRVRSRPC